MENKELTHYQPFLKDILSKIQLARYEMLKTVSKQTVTLYWEIGKSVSEKVNSEKMGQICCRATLKRFTNRASRYQGFFGS